MHDSDTHPEDITLVFSAEKREEVRRTLEDILSSAPLRSTLQCKTLLQYIVEHTLSGDVALLRERVIGKEVFGREATYEPGEDPVVRIRAADLRKRLAVYYQSLHTVPKLRIEVPSGSYRASFLWKESEPLPALGSHTPFLDADPVPGDTGQSTSTLGSDAPLLVHDLVVASPLTHVQPSAMAATERAGQSGWRWIAVAVLLAAVVLAGANWYSGRADRILRAFWAPLLDSSKPVLISIGSNAVYRVSDKTAEAYGREHNEENSGMEFFPEFAPDQNFASTGLAPAPDSFVALGDVASVSNVVAMFSHFSKAFQERFPNDVSFAEVRSSPTILIGGFNNPMTRALTKDFRYVLAARNHIVDRYQPGRAWDLHASTDSHDTEDFAIVTRVLRNGEDEPLVSVAGMGQYGTLAAADFICSPENLSQLAARLGKNWQHHNMQVVLRVKIVNFKPASTAIIATHTW